MELIHSYNAHNADYPDNKQFLLKEAFESHLCGLAVMKGIRDASDEITDFVYKTMNPLAKSITGVYDDNPENHTLLSTYPGPKGRRLMEKFLQVLLSKTSGYFGTVLGTDGNVWSAAGIAHEDEVIVVYTNLSDYALINEFVGQTTITIEVQNAVRNRKNEVTGYQTYFITDVSGNRQHVSQFAVCRRLVRMFPADIVRACLDDLKEVLAADHFIQLKEYYGTAGQKTWLKNSVVKFKDSGIITFIDLSGANIKPGVSENVVVQLHRANVELDEVSKILAHDLKEPLRKIAMFHGLLEESMDEPEKRDKYSRNIRYIIHALQVKLDDLLLYMQIENELNITEVDMNDVVRRVLLSLDYSMPEPAPVISVAPLPTIKADANMMFMLFQSLLANAIEFKTSGQLKVAIDCKIEEDEYRFCVRDNGIGIDKKYADKIFGLFQRLDPDAYGTGLGLAVCKKIAELHGGKIWFESKEGKGTTFYISMPRH